MRMEPDRAVQFICGEKCEPFRVVFILHTTYKDEE